MDIMLEIYYGNNIYMDEYISLFKLYPDVFPSGYFKFLKSSLQKHNACEYCSLEPDK